MNNMDNKEYWTYTKKKKIVCPIFHPNDQELLTKLIDETPGVHNVHADPKVLNELWDNLAAIYNKRAVEFRHVSLLRRKFKNIRMNVKKHSKEMIKIKLGLKPGRPNLPPTFAPVNNLARPPNLPLGFTYIPEAGPSGIARNNHITPGNNPNFAGPFHYDASDRSFISPPRAQNCSNETLDSQMSNNEQLLQSTSKRYVNVNNDFDPFRDEANKPFNEDGSVRGSDHIIGNADVQRDIALLKREHLELEIACRKEAHELLLIRTKAYYDLQMRELEISIHQMQRKHNLEMTYVNMKCQHFETMKKKKLNVNRNRGGGKPIRRSAYFNNLRMSRNHPILDNEMDLLLESAEQDIILIEDNNIINDTDVDIDTNIDTVLEYQNDTSEI